MESLGNALLESGTVDAGQLDEGRALRKRSGVPLGRCLVQLEHLEESALLKVYASRFQIPLHHMNGHEIPAEIIASVPKEIALAHQCVPIGRQNGTITLAIADPAETDVLNEVRFATGCAINPVLCPENEINEAIEKYYDVTVEKILEDFTNDDDAGSDPEEYFIHDLEEKASEPTLINLVNLIISEAIQQGASDIHIEPFELEMKIKYRIDGILHENTPPPKHLQAAIVSRVKIMAGMDIAKRHIPQDGHIRINLARAEVDIRVSTIPTIFGESVVMRLLNRSATRITLSKLGFSERIQERLDLLLTRNFGIVLVCGPTGSGKTTTLYAALTKMFTPEKKMITIEDPVEYQLTGINQIQVQEKRGMTFSSGLRAILRQDPDILMVGEIRDIETAEIAIRGALTGHLIFSTLHTNDAASSVTRLMDMGVEPFLIASSLQGVIAQRLVRRLCPHCRSPYQPDPSLFAQFGKTEEDVQGITFYEAKGCDECKGWGYSGRVCIAELLLLSSELQHAILNRESSPEIKRLAMSTMKTIREDGWDKIAGGITTFDDVLRQTQRDEIELQERA